MRRLHEVEVRCACGARWRLKVTIDDTSDADLWATCTACGDDTFDVDDLGEIRSAGRGS